MPLEGFLGRLHALLGLEPVHLELVLDVVDHDGVVVAAAIAALLGGGVGALQLEVLVLLLEELAAVAGHQEAVLLDLVGVGEQLIPGDDVLSRVSVCLHISGSIDSEHADVRRAGIRETNLVDDHDGERDETAVSERAQRSERGKEEGKKERATGKIERGEFRG
jgi:hypothetical protein